jgi:hypothetical protein
MADTVFRSKTDNQNTKEPEIKASTPGMADVTHVETPYLDTPNFLDSYFGIGTEWHDQDASFYPEISKIDGFIKEKINAGEVGNNQSDVKEFLRGLLKLNNLQKESRSVVKLEVLANYVDFLSKNSKLKSNLKRYAY